MKRSRIAWLYVFLTLPLGGCATMDAIMDTPPSSTAAPSTHLRSASDVLVTSELSGAQASEMRLVDKFDCKQDIGVESESLCLSQLKDQAHRAGAELVVLENKTPIACRSASDKGSCFTMKGAAYARRTSGAEGRNAYGSQKRSVSDVQFVSDLNTSERGRYEHLGGLNCRQDITLGSERHPSTPEQTCRVKMQSEAFDRGGDVIVIEAQETIPCRHPTVDKGPCVAMIGRVYKDRSLRR
jgi:hypothetical protein